MKKSDPWARKTTRPRIVTGASDAAAVRNSVRALAAAQSAPGSSSRRSPPPSIEPLVGSITARPPLQTSALTEAERAELAASAAAPAAPPGEAPSKRGKPAAKGPLASAATRTPTRAPAPLPTVEEALAALAKLGERPSPAAAALPAATLTPRQPRARRCALRPRRTSCPRPRDAPAPRPLLLPLPMAAPRWPPPPPIGAARAQHAPAASHKRAPTSSPPADQQPPLSLPRLQLSPASPPPPARTPAPPPAPPSAAPAPTAQPRKPRYPPLVVERLPNWQLHFRALRDELGRAPRARPYGQGIRFTPDGEKEYRVVQRYLTELEKTDPGLVWFSYSLPDARPLKVAIRGLPADTAPADISAELQRLGHEPEYVRGIRARQGRPGCIFYAQVKRTAATPGIYNISELLCMPGVKIEAWRGKRGPAQCHRCQAFRHSSHNCHRPLACVRCGGPHAAGDCDRPHEQPPTCANCGGSHTANNQECPVLRREARNRRAGTVAVTAPARKAQPRDSAKLVEAAAGSATLMAPANDPSQPPSRRRKRGGCRRKRQQPQPPAPPPATAAEPRPATRPQPRVARTSAHAAAAPPPAPARGAGKEQRETDGGDTRRETIAIVVTALQEVLRALQSGEDAAAAIHRGLAALAAA